VRLRTSQRALPADSTQPMFPLGDLNVVRATVLAGAELLVCVLDVLVLVVEVGVVVAGEELAVVVVVTTVTTFVDPPQPTSSPAAATAAPMNPGARTPAILFAGGDVG
jgi:hypothetical protein